MFVFQNFQNHSQNIISISIVCFFFFGFFVNQKKKSCFHFSFSFSLYLCRRRWRRSPRTHDGLRRRRRRISRWPPRRRCQLSRRSSPSNSRRPPTMTTTATPDLATTLPSNTRRPPTTTMATALELGVAAIFVPLRPHLLWRRADGGGAASENMVCCVKCLGILFYFIFSFFDIFKINKNQCQTQFQK